MSRILVTPRSLTAVPGDLLAPIRAAGHEIVLSPAGRQPDEAALVGLVPGCLGWIAGVEPITARVLAAADRLRVISRNGTGVDSIDREAARRNGVRILTAAGANAAAVAELTLGLMLAGIRHLLPSCLALKAGRWERREGRELGGLTVGIVGCGAVGQAVARLLGAFGAAVLAHDVAPSPAFAAPGRFAWSGLDALLSGSDVVTLHCPPPPDGTPLLGARRLALLRPGAGLVNTARAGLVDEAALLAALDSGAIGWFATDVFAVEPPPGSALIAHPRVIATPHIGGFTVEGGREAARMAVANLLAALEPAAAGMSVGAAAR